MNHTQMLLPLLEAANLLFSFSVVMGQRELLNSAGIEPNTNSHVLSVSFALQIIYY